MTELSDTLGELIEICRDGHAFYMHTAEQIEDAEVHGILLEMARVRQRLLQDFLELLEDRGEQPPKGGTLWGRMRQLYAGVRAQVSDDPERVYVFELEEAEDRLLHSFEEAMLKAAAPSRVILKRYLPLARQAHERMKNLKTRKSEKVRRE